jgi:hypothetical protein
LDPGGLTVAEYSTIEAENLFSNRDSFHLKDGKFDPDKRVASFEVDTQSFIAKQNEEVAPFPGSHINIVARPGPSL